MSASRQGNWDPGWQDDIVDLTELSDKEIGAGDSDWVVNEEPRVQRGNVVPEALEEEVVVVDSMDGEEMTESTENWEFENPGGDISEIWGPGVSGQVWDVKAAKEAWDTWDTSDLGGSSKVWQMQSSPASSSYDSPASAGGNSRDSEVTEDSQDASDDDVILVSESWPQKVAEEDDDDVVEVAVTNSKEARGRRAAHEAGGVAAAASVIEEAREQNMALMPVGCGRSIYDIDPSLEEEIPVTMQILLEAYHNHMINFRLMFFGLLQSLLRRIYADPRVSRALAASRIQRSVPRNPSLGWVPRPALGAPERSGQGVVAQEEQGLSQVITTGDDTFEPMEELSEMAISEETKEAPAAPSGETTEDEISDNEFQDISSEEEIIQASKKPRTDFYSPTDNMP